MKNVIGKKNKTYLIETIITVVLIITLILLNIYRIIENEDGFVMMVVFVGLSIVCLYWGYIEVKNIYKYLKTPTDMVKVDDEFIYIYEYKNFSKIQINKIKEIKVVGVVKKLLAHEATLYIRDEEQECYIKLLKDIEDVKKKIEDLVNGISIH